MSATSKEAQLILTLAALQNDSNLSVSAAAKIYNVDRSTLRHRRAGGPARCETVPNSRKLTESEEEAIVQYIIDLDARAFPPRLRGVKNVAN